MSRPKPTVLLATLPSKKHQVIEVLEAAAIYAVYFMGRPVNLRSRNALLDYPGPKYKKVSFSNAGHAFNLRDRLNAMYRTEQFSVVKLVLGERVEED